MNNVTTILTNNAQQLDDSLVGHAGLAVVVVAPDGETLFATSGDVAAAQAALVKAASDAGFK